MWARLRRRPQASDTLVGSVASSLRPSCSGGGGGFVPSPSLSVFPQHYLICGGHSGSFSPRGNSAPPGVLVACSDSNPPPTFWRDLCGFSATPEDSRPSSSSPALEESWATPEASRPLSSPRTPKDLSAGLFHRRILGSVGQ